MQGNTDAHRRADEARTLWHEGDHAFHRGELKVALRCYQAAHQLVVDQPRLHRAAHQRLAEVHRELGMWTAWARDNALLITAPLGSFHAVGAVARVGRLFVGAQIK
jgi:hypothetical protein